MPSKKTPRPKSHRDNTGNKNPKAKHWILVDPNGSVHEVFGEFKQFCQENGLVESTFKKSIKTGKWPTQRRNLGWSIK